VQGTEQDSGGDIVTTKMRDPIIGFVFGQKGLMYNVRRLTVHQGEPVIAVGQPDSYSIDFAPARCCMRFRWMYCT